MEASSPWEGDPDDRPPVLAGHFLTLDEWDALELDERFRYELVEGVVTVMMRPRSRHQRTQVNLVHRLGDQVPGRLTVQAVVSRSISTPWSAADPSI